MKKYRCKICGHIYDESKEKIKFEDLPEDWICPLCKVGKNMFEEIIDEPKKTLKNAVEISDCNICIERNIEKCIDCGICKQTCIKREGMDFKERSKLCVGCGQCIQSCPFNAIKPKYEYEEFIKAKNEGKICIAYTSPATRVSIGDLFKKEHGSFEQDKLVGLLKELGFDYVFDTTFAADLTIMEEANELVERINNKDKLPMFTSCCPAWIKYAEQFYPEILDNISTCKSPIGMMGQVVKEYFTQKNNIDKKNIYTVAITPCTAKKYEVKREEISGTDSVITVSELASIIKEKNISYDDIIPSSFDTFFEMGSGAGMIFGNTGGVMEAAIRTAYYKITGENLAEEKIEFKSVRGLDNVKEATIYINDLPLKVAVIHQMSSAKEILESVKNGTCKYDYIEIMNCLGGCVGGGGQPKFNLNNEKEILKNRIDSLYKQDNSLKIRNSHDNPQIIKIYKEFLIKPLSNKAIELLHTKYFDKSNYNK